MHGSRKIHLFTHQNQILKRSLRTGVLGDGLSPFRHSVLGQLPGQEEPDGGLDLPGGDCGPLVVVSEAAGLGSDPLEQVIHERVHDTHGLRGDPSVGVNLLEDLIDVDGIRFLPLLASSSLGPPLGLLLRSNDRLLDRFTGLGRHREELRRLSETNRTLTLQFTGV
jgi:hypothetical protein